VTEPTPRSRKKLAGEFGIFIWKTPVGLLLYLAMLAVSYFAAVHIAPHFQLFQGPPSIQLALKEFGVFVGVYLLLFIGAYRIFAASRRRSN